MNIIPASDSPDAYRVEGVLDIQTIASLQHWVTSHPSAQLDLREAKELDSAAALVLWEHWGDSLYERVMLTSKQGLLFKYIQESRSKITDQDVLESSQRPPLVSIGAFIDVIRGLLTVSGKLLLDIAHLVRHPRRLPLKELSAACYRSGVSALPITVVVGFLIGIVLSYLSSLSLQDFGAESFLPMVMGIGILRELGPLLTSIVLAGRSGSAITAGLGAMRLTQELDALSALGISHSMRLVIPRVAALAIMTPLLAVCTNASALIGGLLSGWFELDLAPEAFLYGLRKDVPLSDLWIGLFKSTVFGAAVGIIACHYGLSTKANTQSLATNTTRSVVLSISVIILLDAVFAVLFKDI